jgi:hypothetical protein
MTPIAGTLTEGRIKRELESLHFQTDELLSGLEKINGGLWSVAAELDRLSRAFEGPIRARLDELTRVVRRLKDAKATVSHETVELPTEDV